MLDIKSIVENLRLPIVVVGAGARILIFDNRYNIDDRATNDLDFAVQVRSWSDFQTLNAHMTQTSNLRFRPTNIQHRFIHISTNIEVDIVPFGDIGEPNQEIQWSNGIKMSVVGFNEAFSTAESIAIEDIEFKVINLPFLAVFLCVGISLSELMIIWNVVSGTDVVKLFNVFLLKNVKFVVQWKTSKSTISAN